ncbi:MAG: LysM peptidoglycan-binding domain-containing protein [Chitinophagales bacterium]|nr:LysM peptidoglycan-binding domain-containing protein [Chitinophagales bacterium]
MKSEAEQRAKQEEEWNKKEQEKQQAAWDKYLQEMEKEEGTIQEIEESIIVEEEEIIIEELPQQKTYVVKPGDTLYSLSNKFYITVEELRKLNNMPDNNLRVGQVLVVSP